MARNLIIPCVIVAVAIASISCQPPPPGGPGGPPEGPPGGPGGRGPPKRPGGPGGPPGKHREIFEKICSGTQLSADETATAEKFFKTETCVQTELAKV